MRIYLPQLLLKLREGETDHVVGILSSHPFAVMAALRAFGRGLQEVDLSMIKTHAAETIATAPVGYVRKARIHGSLFEDSVGDGAVSCANTDFFVDHTEPLEALAAVHAKGVAWPLGELPEGYEFLVMAEC